MIPGCDVSAYQGPPPWRAGAGTIDWAGVKFTELQPGSGSYRDPDAPADWRYLADHGKGRVAYLFGHPATSVTATVALFAGMCDAVGLAGGDGIALDLEVTDGLSAARVSAWAHDVLRLLERELHRVPLLYTFISFADEGNCAGLGGYPLWIADPSRPRGQPRVPAPWTRWTIHQYAISGNIDRDVADFPSVASMQHDLGTAGVPKLVEHTTAGERTIAELAAAHKCEVSTILRLTAEHSPGAIYPTNVAHWLNDVFAGKTPVTENMPAGLRLYLPG